MFYYRLYGSVIESDLEFFQLVKDTTKLESDILIKHGNVPENIIEMMSDRYTYMTKDFCWFHNDTVICWVKNGRELFYEAKEDANFQYLKTYILGYGLSMLFYQRGQLAVHCSGISVNGNGILISGQSGSGKSTLTGKFLEKGCGFLADDILVTSCTQDGQFAYPAFPYQKLCRDVVENRGLDESKLIYIDEQKDKFLVPFEGEFSLEPKPLKAMVVLNVIPNGFPVSVEEIKGISKLQMILQNLFLRMEILFRDNNPYAVQMASELAGTVTIVVVNRPEGVDTVNEQYNLLMEKLMELDIL